MTALVSSFKKTVQKYRMLMPGDRVLVAVSGGPDSVALLYLLHSVANEWKFDLSIGHLNHMVRGKDSDGDADFVSQLGLNLRIPVVLNRIDVVRERAVLKTSFQEAARILRYGFLEDTLQKIGGNKIALGHTAVDQGETVLMNLLRGSGSSGLSGIPPMRKPYIRPLIQSFRPEIIRFLKKEKVSFRTDASNQDRRYLRNRIRLDLVPKLVEEYNPKIQSHLLDMAEIFRDEDALLEEVVRQKLDLCTLKGEPGVQITMDRNYFLMEPPALRKRLIRKAIRFVKGDLRRVTAGHVRSVDDLALNSVSGKSVHLPGPLKVLRDDKELSFLRNLKRNYNTLIKGQVEEVFLQIPGTTRFPKFGVTFQTQLLDAPIRGWEKALGGEAYLNFYKTGEDLRLRFFKAGDRFSPLGMDGTKKLKTFFIDAKVPREERNQIPLLTSRTGDIIWVCGYRISNNYKITPATQKILYIKGDLKKSDIGP